MTHRDKWRLLTALLLVWVALLISQVLMEPEPQRAPLTYQTGTVAKRTNQTPALKRPLLVKARQHAFPSLRNITNIFAPLDRHDSGASDESARRAQSPASARLPIRVTKKPESTAPIEIAPPPPSPAVQQAAPKANPQFGQYRFFGYLVRRGESMAFIAKGHDIYIVKAGDLLDSMVRVKTIDPTSVKLVDARTAAEATIPLTKDGAKAS